MNVSKQTMIDMITKMTDKEADDMDLVIFQSVVNGAFKMRMTRDIAIIQTNEVRLEVADFLKNYIEFNKKKKDDTTVMSKDDLYCIFLRKQKIQPRWISRGRFLHTALNILREKYGVIVEHNNKFPNTDMNAIHLFGKKSKGGIMGISYINNKKK